MSIARPKEFAASQPTVEEALEFADEGWPASVLADEVRRLRGADNSEAP